MTDTDQIQQALWTMFDDFNYSISQNYETIVIFDNGSGSGYPMLQSVLHGGTFADAGISNDDLEEELDNTQVTSIVQTAATNIFLYTAVKTLWRDADVVIIYIPYGGTVDQYKYVHPCILCLRPRY